MSREAKRTKDRLARLHQMYHSPMSPVKALMKLLGQ